MRRDDTPNIQALTDAARYGAAIRLAREASGLTLGEAAMILDIGVAQLSELELRGVPIVREEES